MKAQTSAFQTVRLPFSVDQTATFVCEARVTDDAINPELRKATHGEGNETDRSSPSG